MNWVGGARSRVKQSQERKIQKEFFERQKLAKKVNIHRQQSPKGHRKPISLDLLSLQTINQTHQGENAIRKQPVKVVLGDRSNLLPRRQEDLELPMSPIRNPSSLAFLDSNTEMEMHPMHFPHQLHKPVGGLEKHTGSRLQFSDNKGKLPSHVEHSNTALPLHASKDVSQLSESLLSFANSQEPVSLSRPQKHIKQLPELEDLNHDQCLPMPKKDLLAFHRAEKEKYMSSKPLARQVPHQVTMYNAKPTTKRSLSLSSDNLTIDDENPAISRPSMSGITSKNSAAANVAGASKRNTTKSNNNMSDPEKKVLLGLDHDTHHNSYDAVDHIVPCKKAKSSSFEEMINDYEKPVTSKKYTKPMVNGKHDAWRKFTHEKSSPTADDVYKVPDISMIPPVRKASLFFKQNPSKKPPSMKRPSTVLQELLCLDEDLNNSELFQTQDFTFEDVLAIDFEEPLKEFQHHTCTANAKGMNQATDVENTVGNYDTITPTEEVKTMPDQELRLPSPEGTTLSTSSGHISVGVQCDNVKSTHDMETQTEQHLTHSAAQCDTVQLVDVAVQATVSNCSIMTQTLDNKSPNHHQVDDYADKLAEAQNTIVWQSLMIKILEIEANTKI